MIFPYDILTNEFCSKNILSLFGAERPPQPEALGSLPTLPKVKAGTDDGSTYGLSPNNSVLMQR